MSEELPQGTPPQQQTKDAADEQPLILQSEGLFQGKREITILHKGEHYRLRITKKGKLILSK